MVSTYLPSQSLPHTQINYQSTLWPTAKSFPDYFSINKSGKDPYSYFPHLKKFIEQFLSQEPVHRNIFVGQDMSPLFWASVPQELMNSTGSTTGGPGWGVQEVCRQLFIQNGCTGSGWDVDNFLHSLQHVIFGSVTKTMLVIHQCFSYC